MKSPILEGSRSSAMPSVAMKTASPGSMEPERTGHSFAPRDKSVSVEFWNGFSFLGRISKLPSACLTATTPSPAWAANIAPCGSTKQARQVVPQCSAPLRETNWCHVARKTAIVCHEGGSPARRANRNASMAAAQAAFAPKSPCLADPRPSATAAIRLPFALRHVHASWFEWPSLACSGPVTLPPNPDNTAEDASRSEVFKVLKVEPFRRRRNVGIDACQP